MSVAAGDAAAQQAAPPRAACRSVWVTAPTFGKPARRLRKPLTFSAAEVLDLFEHPDRLTEMAAAARAQGVPDAAARVVDLIESVVR